MGVRRTISNSFTVSTIEDAIIWQSIYFRSNASSISTPATSQDDNNLPTGWTTTPQGVTSSLKNEFISQRYKEAGVWSHYSPPALYAHYAEDGTSIHIVGSAVGISAGYPAGYPANPVEGDTMLLTTVYSPDNIDVYESGSWEAYSVPEGDGYILRDGGRNDGHLYVRTGQPDPIWEDVGLIQGPAGDDAVSYQIILDSASAIVNTSSKLTAHFLCHALKSVGETQSVAVSGAMYANGGQCSDEGNNRYGDDGSFEDLPWSGNYTEILLEYKVSGTTVATASIPIVIQGKMSRNLWYAGYLPVGTFKATDTSAPYVKTGELANGLPVCYAYKGENGNAINFPATVQAYASNSNWGQMESSFEYLITKAVFAALAKLGKWTFNGDFMYSDMGINASNSVPTTQGNLEYFGIDDPDGDNEWIPNISMDANNGMASFGRDKVRLNPDGSGWVANKNIQWDASGNANFNGIVRSKLSYSPTLEIMDDTILNPATQQAGCYVLTPGPSNILVTLPPAANYDGLELKFFVPYGSRAIGYALVTISTGDQTIGFQNYNVYKSFSPAFVAPEAGSLLSNANTLYLYYNQIITFKSITYQSLGVSKWYVISGQVSANIPT